MAPSPVLATRWDDDARIPLTWVDRAVTVIAYIGAPLFVAWLIFRTIARHLGWF